MGHPHIEELLFSLDPLSGDQQESLQRHLQSCQMCQELADAWQGVEAGLQAAPLRKPAPGFSHRWLARLEGDRLQTERRQTWLTLLALIAGAVMLLGLLAGQLLLTYGTPTQVLLASVDQVVAFFSSLNVLAEVSTAAYRTVPTLFAVGAWIAVSSLSVLSLLWIVSIHQFTIQRRVLR